MERTPPGRGPELGASSALGLRGWGWGPEGKEEVQKDGGQKESMQTSAMILGWWFSNFSVNKNRFLDCRVPIPWVWAGPWRWVLFCFCL